MNSAARNAMRSGLRGCQKTIKYSSATEQRGKSERGKKPLSRSIKQFSELFKFRKLDGQRGEKVFFSPLPARNAMRSGLLLLKGPLCQEGAVAAGDWGRNPRRSVCRGGRPCPPLRTQAKCSNKLTALIPSVCAKRRQLPLMQSRGAFVLPKRSPAGRHGPPGGAAYYKVCSARPLSDD